MRYIKKGKAPSVVIDYISLRTSAGQIASYSDFKNKEALNNLLRAEQGGICCYCMQRIDHYKGTNEAGSHNEHLVPQQGPHGDPNLQMDYGNMYACCNYTKGYPVKDTFCGEHKADNPITNFIQKRDCREYFKYNILGEILPNGLLEKEEEYLAHEASLPTNQRNALNTIITLNLNQAVLKKRRQDIILGFIKQVLAMSPGQAQTKIQQINNSPRLIPFVETVIFYLKKRAA
jgi:uncharacterized protein (TIGR02646 family)